MSEAGIARAFGALQRLYVVIDPDYGEKAWQRAHDFDALPEEQRSPGHWYKVRDGSGVIHVDENLNGQWFKELPPGNDPSDVVELPPRQTPTLFDTMRSLVGRLPAATGSGPRLPTLLSDLARLSAPDHDSNLAAQFREGAFAAFFAGQDKLLEYLGGLAERYLNEGLASGQVTGRDAGALILIDALARAVAGSADSQGAGRAWRVLGMLSSPGADSVEAVAARFVRDCLANGLGEQALSALDRLRGAADEALQSAREGPYPQGHPELMLDFYYFGLFLAAPRLRAVMIGYEVAGGMPGLTAEECKGLSSWANAAEEKLVRVLDVMLYAVRDSDGQQSRLKSEEIRRLIGAGEEDKAEELAMRLVDLQLYYPKPFKSVLLETHR